MTTKTKAKPKVKTAADPGRCRPRPYKNDATAKLCLEIQKTQKHRLLVMGSRIMNQNRLTSVVVETCGYSAWNNEKDREKARARAREIIEAAKLGDWTGVSAGTRDVVATMSAILQTLQEVEDRDSARLEELAAQLPVAAWVNQEEQKGFDFRSLGTIIGETGDLRRYANPGKVWRRLGLAPFEKDGIRLMGSTWRYGKQGKLAKEDWEEFGYSKRRRSRSYIIGQNLMMCNFRLTGRKTSDGKAKKESLIYRRRYEEAREAYDKRHPPKPKTLYSPKRSQLHGMLLASKLLVKNLWIEWQRCCR
jgi:hypothetical protein